MDDGRRWRLCGMMAMIYAVQGAWWPLLAVHLEDMGYSGRARGWIFATYAIGSLATPLGAGQLADRLMPTQRLMGLIYGLGALFLVGFALLPPVTPAILFALFVAYWLLTAPGYGLSNSVAFRNLTRPGQQFGGVRLWGTIGWMVAGWLVTAALTAGGAGAGRSGSTAFAVSALLSLGFAIYCLTALPNTPPVVSAGTRVSDLRAGLDLLRKPEFAGFLGLAFAVSLTMPFVYQTVPGYLARAGLERRWVASAMTLSQLPEIAALAALPWMHRRFGVRGALAIGIGAWAAEYLILAMQPPLGLALCAIPLNGVAIAGFAVTGQMFLDGQAPADRRASTQALWIVVVSGLGALLGSVLAGEVLSWSRGGGRAVFLVPGLINVAALVALWGGFRRADSLAPSWSAPAALAGGKLSPGSRSD